jgi:3-oxoacyl-[acyl-carrier protein] reductase
VTDSLVVVVSGGSKGLGRDLVDALIGDGHRVATFSRSSTPFIDERVRADPDGRAFLWQPLDMQDLDGLRRFVSDVAARFGQIDGLVNNAAIALEGVLPMLRGEDVHRVLATNIEGTIALTQATSRVMLTRRSGSIIHITSIVGLRGYAGLSVYSATKGALDAFGRSLARELGPRGIRVNSIAPGYLETELSASLDGAQKAQIVRRTPLGRLGTPADVAGAVRFLLSADARFITGTTLTIDGGITC